MKITGESIPASQFAVKNIVYPKVSEMAAFERCEWSNHIKRGQEEEYQGVLQKIFRQEGV